MSESKNDIDFNKWATSLIKEVRLFNDESNKSGSKGSLAGSWGEKETIDLSGIDLTDAIISGRTGQGDNDSFIGIKDGQEIQALIGKGRKSISSLVKEIVKKPEYGNKVGFDFIENIALRWIVSAFKNKKIEIDFITYLDDKIVGACNDYEIKFEVLNLSIDKEFEIEGIKFTYLKRELLEEIFNSNSDEVAKKKLINDYAGKVFVSCVIPKTEQKKAEQLAFEKCCYAVDLLKCFYQSKVEANRPVYFEIDRRCRYRMSTTQLTHENGSKHPTLSNYFPIDLEYLEGSLIDWMLQKDKQLLQKTALNEKFKNKLEELVRDAVVIFSGALSEENNHLRIVNFMTIWESLLLHGKKPNIKETIIKYGVKIVFDELEERRELSKLISKMYAFRSNYLHRAEQDNFTVEELFKFRRNTFNLILGIMYLSKKFDSKESLLQAMDDEIENSFRIGKTLDIRVGDEY